MFGWLCLAGVVLPMRYGKHGKTIWTTLLEHWNTGRMLWTTVLAPAPLLPAPLPTPVLAETGLLVPVAAEHVLHLLESATQKLAGERSVGKESRFGALL